MLQHPLFTPPSSWKPPLLDELPRWENATNIGLDCETRDPNIKTLGPGGCRTPESYVIGVSFRVDDLPPYYLPMRHSEGNLPPRKVLQYLKDQLTRFSGNIVGANLPYDLDFLTGEGLDFGNVSKFLDIQIAAPLINELHMRYSMQAIAERLGLQGKDETLLKSVVKDFGLKNPKSEMYKLPARYVGPYAEVDAKLPMDVMALQLPEIESQGLTQVFDLETSLLPHIVTMRRRGIRVDMSQLEYIERWSLAEETEQLKEVSRRSGRVVTSDDLWKSEALAPVLQAIGIKVGKTAKGKPQVDKDLLQKAEHPVASSLARARKLNKLRTTFAQSVRNHLVNGRIHCTINQLKNPKDDASDCEETKGAAYGRMSCEHPNLQQQPSNDDFAPAWRAIYLPEEGRQWASNDFSAQEPRMAIHYGCIARSRIGGKAWEAAVLARDNYRKNPKTDAYHLFAKMCNSERKPTKQIFLGRCYGMGGAKMCQRLGLPTELMVRTKSGAFFPIDSREAQASLDDGIGTKVIMAGSEGRKIIKLFDDKVPFITALAKAAEKSARINGYVTTLLGRRCRFPTDKFGNYEFTYKAFNRINQGSAGDQTKKALIDVMAAGFDVMLPVHDEIAISVQSKEEAQEASTIMENAIPLQLPSVCDVEVGSSWGHSMGYKGRK